MTDALTCARTFTRSVQACCGRMPSRSGWPSCWASHRQPASTRLGLIKLEVALAACQQHPLLPLGEEAKITLRCSASVKMRSRPFMLPSRQVASSQQPSNCDGCFRGSRTCRRPGSAHASSWAGLGRRLLPETVLNRNRRFGSGGLGHARCIAEAEPCRVALIKCFLQHATATRPASDSQIEAQGR
jgi:hypothetical protein